MLSMPRMKGDPLTLEQLSEKYGDPADHLVEAYFDSLAKAKALADADPEQAEELTKLAQKAKAVLRQCGKRPETADGVAWAATVN